MDGRSDNQAERRVLRELRVAGVIATAADRIVILDATRLYDESGESAGL